MIDSFLNQTRLDLSLNRISAEQGKVMTKTGILGECTAKQMIWNLFQSRY